MTIGYTTGVFDLFHVGHLNILKRAKSMCDRLIVGVSTDEAVEKKHKKAIIPFIERCAIVEAVRYVDSVVPQVTIDKFEEWSKLNFDILFVGSDWHGSREWGIATQKLPAEVKIVYLPYTIGVSSTLINKLLNKERKS